MLTHREIGVGAQERQSRNRPTERHIQRDRERHEKESERDACQGFLSLRCVYPVLSVRLHPHLIFSLNESLCQAKPTELYNEYFMSTREQKIIIFLVENITICWKVSVPS